MTPRHNLLIVGTIGPLRSYDLPQAQWAEIAARLKLLDDLAEREEVQRKIENMEFKVPAPIPDVICEDYRPTNNEPFYRGLRKYRKKNRQ